MDEKQNSFETFDVESLEELLKERGSDSAEIKMSAKALRDADNNFAWLFVLATYEVKGETQYSYGYAWTTAADGRTPKPVDSLSIRVEAGGFTTEPFTRNNVDKVGTVTKGAISGSPHRVTAYAVSENPHIEAMDTSDD